MKLPLRPDASFSSIGDERKNIGILVRAILRSKEGSYDKWVIGEAHRTTMSLDVEALDRVVKEQLGNETQVAYEDISLQEYEAVWGPTATQKAPMFQYYELQDDAFVDLSIDAGQEGQALYPHDLGVTIDELTTVEDCLRSFDWKNILHGQGS